MSEKPYRLGAHALIFDQDHRLLLIQHQSYHDNQWNFPGGGREANETAIENALREVGEELGLTPDDLKIIGVSNHANTYEFPQTMIDKEAPITKMFRGQHKDHVMFTLTGDKNSINADPGEVRQYKWVPIDELHQYLVFPHQYQEVKPVINDYKRTVQKAVEN